MFKSSRSASGEISTMPEVAEATSKERKQSGLLDKLAVGSAEFLGTAMLVFLTCMGCTQGMSDEFIPNIQRSLTAGMSIMITMHLFAHISGAHCNPMTTICALIIGEVPLIMSPIYFISQIFGSITGYGLLLSATSSQYMNTHLNGSETSANPVCVTSPSDKITPLQAVLVEMCVTLILVFGNCSSWDEANSGRTDSAALRFGFLVTAVSMAVGPYTGGSMNPARSFAPAFWNSHWKNHWIYWVAPITAAVTGSTFYRVVFAKATKEYSIKLPE